MKHLTTLTILFCLLSSVSNAQFFANQFPAQNFYGNLKVSLKEISGTPYLDEEYRVGKITAEDGNLYKDMPLRYNAYSDVLEFTRDGVSYNLIPKSKVKRVEIGDQIFVYMSYEPVNPNNMGYFTVLSEGKATLLGRYTKQFHEEEPAKGYADPKPARFDDPSETFWISIQQAPAQKILNSKKLLEILADKKSEIQSYLSKQKLSVKKGDDLKKIITYYNSL